MRGTASPLHRRNTVGVRRLHFAFRDNTAHSNFAFTGGNDRYPPLTHGYGLFLTNIHPEDQSPIVFENFTAFKNSIGGIWIDDDDHIVRGALLADNASGIVIAQSTVEGSVIVGRTANTNGETKTLGDGFSSVGINTASMQGTEKGPTVRTTAFVNLADAAFGLRNPALLPSSSFSGITLVNTPQPISFRLEQMSGGLVDLDGSLTGVGGPRVVVGNRPLQAGPGCTLNAAWNAYLCPASNKLASIAVDMLGDSSDAAWEPITVTRDDGVSGPMGRDTDATGGMVLSGRTYRLSFNGGFTRGSYLLSTDDDDDEALTVGEWAVVGVPLPGGAAYAYFDNPNQREEQPDPSRQLTPVGSLAELAGGPGNQIFSDQGAGLAYVKLIGAVVEPKIFICRNAGCAP